MFGDAGSKVGWGFEISVWISIIVVEAVTETFGESVWEGSAVGERKSVVDVVGCAFCRLAVVRISCLR